MWRVIYGYFKEHRRSYVGGIVALVVVDILDLLPPLIVKVGVDALEDRTSGRWLAFLALAYVGVTAAQGFFRFQWRIRFMGNAHRIDRSLKLRLFERMLRMPVGTLGVHTTGNLMARSTNDVQSVKDSMGIGLLIFLDAVFYCLTIPVLMFYLSPKLALLSLAAMPFVPILVYKVGNVIDKKFEAVQGAFERISERAHEAVTGIRVVKAYNLGEREVGRFREECRSYRKKAVSYSFTESYFAPILEFAAAFGTAVLLFVGGPEVIAGVMTIGTFVALKSYISKMVWPMSAFGWSYSMFKEAWASQRRIDEVLSVPPEGEGQPEVKSGAWSPSSIRISNLTFRFPGENRPALWDLNLAIRIPSQVALVGRIGSGKSALVQILTRLYDPPRGTVFLDERDVLDIPLEELRSLISVAPQEPFLFSESIQDNILLGRGADDAAMEGLYRELGGDARRASQYFADDAARWARFAWVHEDIESFPGRYEAQLGERGINLSGGQKKRVALARALAKPAPILILDDPFSAVDSVAESRISESIRGAGGHGGPVPGADNSDQEGRLNLRGGVGHRLLLLITHRLNSISWVDRIVVMDGGRMVEDGTHEALMEGRGFYAELYRRQERLGRLTGS